MDIQLSFYFHRFLVIHTNLFTNCRTTPVVRHAASIFKPYTNPPPMSTYIHHNSHAPERCRTCVTAYNAINGRWCQYLNRYVEHAPAAPCIDNAVVSVV